MHVSDLVKRLFDIMSKQGDIPVVGDLYIEDKQVFLHAPDNTEVLSADDSEILSALLRETKDGRTTP